MKTMKKLTPKQLAKYAVEDAMNRLMDLPFGYSEHAYGANEQYHDSSELIQAKTIEQVTKYVNRILKHIGSEDRYGV